ncbi:MAG: biotin--[acetyl-CoA-carboxylase] ligase, partial [Bdellovibrionota bacterium]
MIANQVVDECESTNDLARALGEAGAPHGTWISARRQTRGRGRAGRDWQSEEGNLFISLVARVKDPALWSWVPLAAAVAVTRAVGRDFPEIPVRIKWPNDLWVRNRKLGGILCEGVGTREAFIVIGIGLNCASAPEILERPATSLSECANRPVTADVLRE